MSLVIVWMPVIIMIVWIIAVCGDVAPEEQRLPYAEEELFGSVTQGISVGLQSVTIDIDIEKDKYIHKQIEIESDKDACGQEWRTPYVYKK